MLIEFWAHWCRPCQHPMSTAASMISNNSKWGEKVRIIAISMDDEMGPTAKKINDRKWHRLEHYLIEKKVNKIHAGNQYDIGGMPHCMLVDKKG
jgi:thiol-disulfide isomerase/thioredoxin